MENTPEIIGTGAVVIKIFIDIISRYIPEEKREYIPLVAMVLGVGWAVTFYDGVLSDAIIYGVTMIGTGAVGINEVVKFGKKKVTSDTEVVPDAVTDEPDERDFPYEEVFGGIEYDPVKFPLNRITIWNQGAQADTKMGCVMYATMHINNGQNIIEHLNYKEVDPQVPWLSYIVKYITAKAEGTSLQYVMKRAIEHGYIKGHTKLIKQKAFIKDAIDRGTFILTGSYYGDWRAVRTTGIFKVLDVLGVGHAFCIVDYDDDYMIAINSYGPTNGVFKISWDDVDSLFSMYALIDARNEVVLEARKTKLNNTLEKIIVKVKKGENIGILDGMLYKRRVDPTYQVKKSLLDK